MSNVDWILITLVRAISRVRANNATLPSSSSTSPFLPSFLRLFCLATEAEYNTRERGNFERKKSERGGEKKKKNSIYPVSDRGEITANKSDNDPGVV